MPVQRTRKQRLKMSIDAKDNGKHSIQITSLNAWLNQSIYSSAPQFLEYFEDIDQLKGRPTKNFKIFIIMDTDDCSKTQLAKYKSKEMFKQHWAHSYIVPIFNTNNLEEVVRSVAIPIEKKKEYIKTKEFIEKTATEKFGLLYPGEYLLKGSDQEMIKIKHSWHFPSGED